MEPGLGRASSASSSRSLPSCEAPSCSLPRVSTLSVSFCSRGPVMLLILVSRFAVMFSILAMRGSSLLSCRGLSSGSVELILSVRLPTAAPSLGASVRSCSSRPCVSWLLPATRVSSFSTRAASSPAICSAQTSW